MNNKNKFAVIVSGDTDIRWFNNIHEAERHATERVESDGERCVWVFELKARATRAAKIDKVDGSGT